MGREDIQEATKEELIAYIHQLENRIDGASKLSQEISMLKAGVAHDLELIRTGEQGDNFEHLKYVCFDKLSPKFNMVKVLMTNINALEDTAPKSAKIGKEKSEEPETIPIAGELEPIPVAAASGGNMFEEISRKITMKKVNGGK